MKRVIVVVLSFSLFFFSCVSEKNIFTYTKSTEAFLEDYQSRMFYEYQSPLNNEMHFFLQLLSSEQFELQLNYDSILETIDRVKEEKPTSGCYYSIVHTKRHHKEVVIVVEWSASDEVFVYILTDSSELINYLP